MPPQKPRLTTKQAAANAQRRAMNERRQKRSQMIRKQKKSEWLAQKRGISTQQDDVNAIDLSQAIANFRRQPATPDTLNQLLMAVQSASMNLTPWAMDDQDHLQQATLLVQQLGETLQAFIASNNAEGSLRTVQVFVQLVSMSSAHKPTEFDYYGRRPPTWSELIVAESKILSCLPLLISLPQSASEEFLKIAETTCWWIGNLTMDCPSCSAHLRQQQDG